MADPVWPTEPWYSGQQLQADFGYLIEHTHRIAGFCVGGLVSLLALGIWWTEPRKSARWIGIVGIVTLLVGFGELTAGRHAQAGQQSNVEVHRLSSSD